MPFPKCTGLDSKSRGEGLRTRLPEHVVLCFGDMCTPVLKGTDEIWKRKWPLAAPDDGRTPATLATGSAKVIEVLPTGMGRESVQRVRRGHFPIVRLGTKS